MRRRTRSLFALCLMSIISGAAASEKPEDEVIRLEKKWADCFRSGNPGPAKQFIADDFIGTSSKAIRYSKAGALKDIIESKGKYSSFTTRDVTVRIYGEAAVAQGTDVWETADQSKEKGSSIWTDTWVRVQGKWLLEAAQDALPESLSK